MNSSDLIDEKLEEQQSCGSKQCPGCGHKFQAKLNWRGLPSGVKFDPTDQELIQHLEGKVEANNMKSHRLIHEFIATIEGEDGICYTHPEKLPGVTRDGRSKHFFHRPSKAYTTGTRKRRKVQSECCDLQSVGETRWHKTGKTRPVLVNGMQKGCKKILVLYTNFGKNRKPEKTNWVMHQYHLGQHEEEKEGELVVSKIFYQTQPRQCNWAERISGNNDNRSEASNNNGEINNSGSASSSSKEIITQNHRDEMSATVVAVPPPPITNFTSSLMEIHQQFKPDQYSFIPFRRTFDAVGIAEASNAREMQASMSACEEVHNINEQHQHQQQIATTAFYTSRPSPPISTIIPPPPLHHASIILDDPFHHASRTMLPNDNFQAHGMQQQHHKMGGRSASGLEELIMGCTSSTDHTSKEGSSITNPQEADEWLKYSSYWPNPDNPNHHG